MDTLTGRPVTRRIGYAVIYADERDYDHVVQRLKAEGCTSLFIDQISSPDDRRPRLRQLCSFVRSYNVIVHRGGISREIISSEDTVVFLKITDLGSQIKDAVAIIELLTKKGASVFITDPDSSKIYLKPMQGVETLKAASELNAMFSRERFLIKEHGRLSAVKTKVGRPPKLTEKDLKEAAQFINVNTKIEEIMERFHIKRAASYKLKRSLLQGDVSEK